ncbi:MAG: hypothetical protein DRP78_02780 [Candidatus Omnitrophota bacterium]|nr:MAG: hypothetical protein DRP78_02780 [Candidatus Omnitrophota bacterium]
MFNKTKKINKFLKLIIILLFFLIPACISISKNQPIVSKMIAQSQYRSALKLLTDNPGAYGTNSQLLYLLDKAYIQHLAVNYEQSIENFAQAKQKIDQLYTKSITKITQTWLLNDYLAPYCGEDFEQVLINIFQALNYAMLNNNEDALVEVRDVDSKLHAINEQYKEGEKNIYKEDAFARFLMGILYEAGKSPEDINDAFVAYLHSAQIYETDYLDNYNVHIPEILKENILTTARFMGLSEFSKYKNKYKGVKFFSLEEKQKKGEVYLIQYNGVCPIKTEENLTIPLLNGQIVKIAFPKYQRKEYAVKSSRFLAKNKAQESFYADTELGEDIGIIAIKNLNRKKIRFIAKSAARAAGRYFIEKQQLKDISEHSGETSAGWFGFFSNIYNLIIEKADLRSWRTLPDQIRIARLILKPGEYEFLLETFNKEGSYLGEFQIIKHSVSAGDKRIFIVHTAR